MDAIGFIASLLTLVSTAVEGAKTINTLYKAPKDLDNLVVSKAISVSLP